MKSKVTTKTTKPKKFGTDSKVLTVRVPAEFYTEIKEAVQRTVKTKFAQLKKASV